MSRTYIGSNGEPWRPIYRSRTWFALVLWGILGAVPVITLEGHGHAIIRATCLVTQLAADVGLITMSIRNVRTAPR